MLIMDKIRSLLSINDDIDTHPLPWDALKVTDLESNQRAAKIRAIEENLGVFPDGSEVPLTLRQRLFFKDGLSKLHFKIKTYDCYI